jgi:hypothetical protein
MCGEKENELVRKLYILCGKKARSLSVEIMEQLD